MTINGSFWGYGADFAIHRAMRSEKAALSKVRQVAQSAIDKGSNLTNSASSMNNEILSNDSTESLSTGSESTDCRSEASDESPSSQGNGKTNPEPKKKELRIDSVVRVILIPSREEYREAGLMGKLFWSKGEIGVSKKTPEEKIQILKDVIDSENLYPEKKEKFTQILNDLEEKQKTERRIREWLFIKSITSPDFENFFIKRFF